MHEVRNNSSLYQLIRPERSAQLSRVGRNTNVRVFAREARLCCQRDSYRTKGLKRSGWSRRLIPPWRRPLRCFTVDWCLIRPWRAAAFIHNTALTIRRRSICPFVTPISYTAGCSVRAGKAQPACKRRSGLRWRSWWGLILEEALCEELLRDI